MDASAGAAKQLPLNHSNRPPYWNHFSSLLQIRFNRTGSLNDLNAAVIASTYATFHNNSDRAEHLHNLSRTLQVRFMLMGSINDLDAAIEASTEALSISLDHPNRAEFLTGLGNSLERRFNRIGSRDDFNAAMDAKSDAVKLIPRDHPNRAGYLHNLSTALRIRFEQMPSSENDLDRAVEASTEAVNLTPHSHPDRAMFLNSLSLALRTRFKQTESNVNDLNAALQASEAAVELTPHNHPNRAGYLHTLGSALMDHYERSRSMKDLNAAVNVYEESLESRQCPPAVRISSAIPGASLIYPYNLQRASRILAAAVELLPTTSPRMLLRNDQQFALSQFIGLARDAAALSLRAGHDVFDALRLLEIGRGVIASVYFDTRSDITGLQKAHPELAEKFKLLRDELDMLDDKLKRWSMGPINLELGTLRRYELAEQFDSMVKSIRSNDNFAQFLLGPSSEELRKLASSGPIVVLNTSRYGSDALLITLHDIQSVSLTNLKYEELEKNAQKLLNAVKESRLATWRRSNNDVTEVLNWLWDVVAEPILRVLQFTTPPKRDDEWPRVWWIPTGLLTFFPIHAAGYYSTSGHRTVLDRVVSSYATTVKALDHASDEITTVPGISSQTVLLGCMVATPKRPSLKFAAQEINAIDSFLPSPIKRFNFLNPTKQKIMEHIEQCSIVHLACHGEVDADPSKSRIVLTDWDSNPFTVAEIAQKKLQQAELAYLSACHTATARNFSLLDESIHMAGAFQLAGFRSVIGTLWQIDDQSSSEIAEFVYRAMLTENDNLDVRRAAYGLHFALRELRDRCWNESRFQSSDPLKWAPYIHVGI